jgi:hypothetical protein
MTVDLLVAPVTVAVDTVIVAVLATLVTKAEQALDRMLAGYLVNAAGVEAEAATARFDNDEVFDEDEDPEEEVALTFKVVVAVTVDTGILVEVAVT